MNRLTMPRFKVSRKLKIFILAVLISISVTYSVYWYVYMLPIYDVKEFDMDVYIGNTAGFNIDTDAVHFGIVPPGSGGERKIILKAGPLKTMVKIEAYGEIAGWIQASDNYFILEPNEGRDVTVFVAVPQNAKVPDYKKGKLRILFIRL